jgi:hypothetical protein
VPQRVLQLPIARSIFEDSDDTDQPQDEEWRADG